MGDPPTEFLERHVEAFNAAVRSGDFTSLVALFADDATLEFAAVPVGPFRGHDAIAAAYAAQPPSDTMRVLAVRTTDDGTVIEDFSWSSDGGARSGAMHLTIESGLIRRLVVVFG